MEPEHVADPVQWWYEKCKTYPRLHQMALDYLTIPGVHLATIKCSFFLTELSLSHLC